MSSDESDLHCWKFKSIFWMKSEKDSNIDNANDMKLGQHQTADKHIYVTVGEHNGVQMLRC